MCILVFGRYAGERLLVGIYSLASIPNEFRHSGQFSTSLYSSTIPKRQLLTCAFHGLGVVLPVRTQLRSTLGQRLPKYAERIQPGRSLFE